MKKYVKECTTCPMSYIVRIEPRELRCRANYQPIVDGKNTVECKLDTEDIILTKAK